MNKSVYVLSKSIGCLRENIIDERYNPEKENKFSANKSVERVWSDYGQYNSGIFTLTIDGKQDVFDLNGTRFDNKVGYTLYFQLRNHNIHTYTIKINCKTSKGKILRKQYKFNEDAPLTHIVYAVITIAYLDRELETRVWDYYCNYSGNSKPSQLLEDYSLIQEAAKEIVKEYDFMELFFQKTLHNLSETLVEELKRLEIIK